jgi:hypothetical protein
MGHQQGKASDRKQRLFAVACCRRIWHLMMDERSQMVVEVAEQFADGLATDEDRSVTRRLAQQSVQFNVNTGQPTAPGWEQCAASVAYYSVAGEAAKAAQAASKLAIEALIWRENGHTEYGRRGSNNGECWHQANLWRDIFGNPFRPVSVDTSWRTSTVLAIAAQMYHSRDFDAMPILADALQDAGCDNEEILNHCRGDSPHSRGCWVVDSILGKQ